VVLGTPGHELEPVLKNDEPARAQAWYWEVESWELSLDMVCMACPQF